jgi:hypothetical protein
MFSLSKQELDALPSYSFNISIYSRQGQNMNVSEQSAEQNARPSRKRTKVTGVCRKLFNEGLCEKCTQHFSQNFKSRDLLENLSVGYFREMYVWYNWFMLGSVVMWQSHKCKGYIDWLNICLRNILTHAVRLVCDALTQYLNFILPVFIFIQWS